MDKTIELKTGKELVDWTTKRLDEVTAQLGQVAENGASTEKTLGSLKLLVDDLARTRVTQEGRSEHKIPASARLSAEQIKKDGFAYGMKAIAQAPLRLEKTTEGSRYFAGDNPIAKFHEAQDDVVIVATLLGLTRKDQIEATKTYRESYLPAAREVEAMLKDAFDIQNTGQGSDFVPAYFSGSLIEAVRINRVFMSIFESLPMPGGNLTIPRWLTDATAYKFDENTSDSGGTAIPDGLASSLITGNVVYTAKGMGLSLTFSKFLTEDSIIEWLPFIRRVGVQALVNAEEQGGVSGDTTATHMDADIAAVTGHAAKAWVGARYVGNLTANPARVDCLGNPINTDAAWRDYALRSLGLMGAYGAGQPGDLHLVASGMLNSQLLAVEAFKTMYANGAAATNANGVIRSPFGWGYILSAYMPANLASTGVNTSAAATLDTTAGMLIHADSWKKGIVREITPQLLVETRAKYDQNELVFTMRQAFGAARKADGTEPHVGYLYNIKAA